MKQKNVDADKICKHIKYTRHWLDKANTDFHEQRFAEGSVILNIARAELTAAWEEVMHLKTQVTKTIPRQARDNWKPLSTVGLLAAGFMISMFVTRLTTVSIPGDASTTITSQSDVMLVREEAAPAVAAEAPYAPSVVEAAPEIAPASADSAESSAQQETAPAPMKSATKSAAKPVQKKTVRFTGASAAPAKSAVEETASLKVAENSPESAVEAVVVTEVVEQADARPAAQEVEKNKTSLHQNDVIDLFNTARKALHK